MIYKIVVKVFIVLLFTACFETSSVSKDEQSLVLETKKIINSNDELTLEDLNKMSYSELTKAQGKAQRIVQIVCVSEKSRMNWFHTYHETESESFKYHHYVWNEGLSIFSIGIADKLPESLDNRVFECFNDPEGEGEYYERDTVKIISEKEMLEIAKK